MSENNTTKKPVGPTAEEEMAQLKKDNEELKTQIKTLMEMMMKSQNSTPAVNIVTPSTDVVLVYCSDSMGYLKTAHVELKFNKWGEEFTLSRSQFDEVVGQYRSWFDAGILAVSGDTEEGIKIASQKGIKTSNELKMDRKTLENIGSMTVDQVEALWNSLSFDEHKGSIVTYVKRKFMEDDPKYTRRDLIDLLNRLTDGGFRREQDELDGRYTYEPIQFNKGDKRKKK